MTQPKHQTTHLSIPCSRQMYCDESECALHPLPIPRLNVSTTIQYWGDSIQAQLECDLRQWVHDNGTARVQSSYVKVGCPWRCNSDLKRLKEQMMVADTIVFSVGSHYEQRQRREFGEFLRRLQPLLIQFTTSGGTLLVRSISATHFNHTNGLYSPKSVVATRACVPHTSTRIPSVHMEQIRELQRFAHAVGGVYVDVYNQSRSGYAEHATTHDGKTVLDCRHFCSSCGMYRRWNVQLINQVVQQTTQISNATSANRTGC